MPNNAIKNSSRPQKSDNVREIRPKKKTSKDSSRLHSNEKQTSDVAQITTEKVLR